jgi:putative hydrolase
VTAPLDQRRPLNQLNQDVAARLDDVAALLTDQRANPFRVRAYRRAAATLGRLQQPVSTILDAEGIEGLERLPGVGEGLARAVADIVRLGYFPMLERLRGETDPVRLLASVPGIGQRLAMRLHEELAVETLADLEAAAHDGRLEDIAGFGQKRLSGIRDVLAYRLARVRPLSTAPAEAPPVSELLDVDREYREAAASDRLPKIAPRRFNPLRHKWLPILHTSRGLRHYTALFSNTARAHQLGKTHDWVVIYRDRGTPDGQWTVVTGAADRWRGGRIVRGREEECARHYGIVAA